MKALIRRNPLLLTCINGQKYLSTAAVASSEKYDVKPLYRNAWNPIFQEKIAFTNHKGQNFKYKELGGKAYSLSQEIKSYTGDTSSRVAFLCPHDLQFPICLWGTWLSNNTAVPLSSKHPENLLLHYVKTTKAKLIVTTKENADKLHGVVKGTDVKLLVFDFDQFSIKSVPEIKTEGDGENALILFTSGTTGAPKGVLLTHTNLEDQVRNITQAWNITHKDSMLHVLPLHHTHGLIHALLSPITVGARCLMLDKFDAARAWKELLNTNDDERPNVLMGVPTVYTKLVEEYENTYGKSPQKSEFVKSVCQQKMRLFLAGSASLPVPIIEKWERYTGHRILERYGMTEIGMALSNPLNGERKPGFVGFPFQSVKLRVVEMLSRTNYKVLAESDYKKTDLFVDKKEKVIGDLLIKGPSVFKEYWENPEATKKEFTDDGWFITGDTVEIIDGYYKILGRKSVDIIKSGGYKLSALEIETQLLSFDEIREVAVMGLPDPTWGQKVGAVIAWKNPEKELSLEEFRALAKTKLPGYACPVLIKCVKDIPKNHLGKVNKKELVKIFG